LPILPNIDNSLMEALFECVAYLLHPEIADLEKALFAMALPIRVAPLQRISTGWAFRLEQILPFHVMINPDMYPAHTITVS